jgi:hypothetical protein
MAARTRIRGSIAGTTIAVTGAGCLIREGQEPERALFRLADPEPPSEIEISVQDGGGPPPPNGPPNFVTSAWRLWPLDGGGYHLAFQPEPGQLRAVLQANRFGSRVTYHEMARVERSGGLSVVFDPLRMPIDQLILIHHLAHRDGFLLHAAGFAVDNVGVAVPGASGAGKSTLSSLLAASLPEASILSDERLVVRSGGGAFEMWGTPWAGTAGIARNEGAPLRALLFPVKDGCHRLSELSARAAVRRLLGTVACPHFDQERSALVLSTLERLVAQVPAFELRFAPDAGVGAVVRDLLHRELRAA